MDPDATRYCPQCEGRFDDSCDVCPVDGNTLEPADPSVLAPGTMVDRSYRIERELGRGGMGVVYLARDVSIGRPCALKVLNAMALADPRATARFKREAGHVSRIDHAHVVKVFGFGQTADGLAYLAMEYVDGRTLADLLKQEILLPREAARIVWQVAKALRAAHDLGIVHRDLTPGNIMRTQYGRHDDFIKVVDFGLARAYGRAGDTRLTGVGSIMGTPSYMSPEQWISPQVDHTSDIYSLAVIATQMLAGGLPPNHFRLALAGHSILEALPENDWPADLKAALARALAAAPPDRYPSALEFATHFVRAIDRWIPADPGVTEIWHRDPEYDPGDDVAPAAVPARRKWSRFTLATIVIAVLAGSGLLYMAIADAPPPPAVDAERDVASTIESVTVAAPDSGLAPNRTARAPESTGTRPAETSTRIAAVLPDSTSDSPPQPEVEPRPAVDAGQLRRLETLVNLDSPQPDSMFAALQLAADLLALGLPDSTRIEVSYRLAETYVYFGREEEACRTLDELITGGLDLAHFARGIASLLESAHCSQRPGAQQPPA